ncbi:type II toxin-antitoxin system RelE/ParE family toxin [candidate division TA06 bacterium]|nr:type II toxin-antitoxin system RelE/ParE family toxin [candidate division TA06 bacterium]
MSGKDGICRIRQGNYRVVYSIDQKEKEVIIWAVRHRKDIYR